MSPAVLALIALIATLALGMTSRVNVGLLGIALAWVIGVYAAGMKADAVIAGFPSGLFITLAGVTFLFAIAKSNGTLDVLTRHATRLVRGDARLLPVLFFAIACAISTVGPGAIATVALVAPFAMATGARARVPYLLSAVMVGTGANAGNLSPISAVGAMVDGLMAKNGMGGHEWKVWAVNFGAHLLVASLAYVFFGGLKLAHDGALVETADAIPPLERRNRVTMAVTAVWIAAVVAWHVNVGLAAFAAGTLLVLVAAVDERDVIHRIPLDVLFMVTGVTMLIGVLEATKGMDLFVSMIARVATPATLNGVIAFVTGGISTYASTSGVVLPAFLPMAPGLVREVGGGDPLAVALSINVGSALVDVSPLSTLGALCVATVADRTEARDLFRKLLIWGISMTIAGALLCGLFAGLVARI
ncbi:MAG TPA: SLC13 family permease [Gemmatimonadaceae bacterium]|nr:SLC13 family permease [Gemmatimonadaceae bacterium]